MLSISPNKYHFISLSKNSNSYIPFIVDFNEVLWLQIKFGCTFSVRFFCYTCDSFLRKLWKIISSRKVRKLFQISRFFHKCHFLVESKYAERKQSRGKVKCGSVVFMFFLAHSASMFRFFFYWKHQEVFWCFQGT